MSMVKVINMNTCEHREKFQGALVTIPAGGHVEMNREDAVLFKSQFKAPVLDKGGIQTPESKKMLKLEPILDAVPDVTEKTSEFTCMKCGFEAKTSAGLAAHTRANHMASMIDDDARKKLEI